jgi:Ca2+-binding RTX toxin-like protein
MRVFLACLLLLLLPAAASGSLVFVDQDGLGFRAFSAEANQVTIEDHGSLVQVTDTGAALTPGSDCVSISEHTARCALELDCFNLSGPYNEHRCGSYVDLGDRDDTLDVAIEIGTAALGGEGDDRILGSPGGDLLLGGPGADFMQGRGSDYDVVAYDEGDRATGVAVQLDDARNDGAAGEGDDARAEGILGTPFADLIVANDVDNVIVGGGGDDRVGCRGGKDTVYTSYLRGADRTCELVAKPEASSIAPGVEGPLTRDNGEVTIRLPSGTACRLRLATAGGRRLGAASVAASERQRSARITLSPRTLRRLSRRPEWTVRLTVTIPDQSITRTLAKLQM